MALSKILADGLYEIAALMTTVTEEFDRISMHGVRVSLLHKQAKALGMSLDIVKIPPKCANEVYEKRMEDRLRFWQSNGINDAAFGDIFLEDIKAYRENNLGKIGMNGIFPIWKTDSRKLADDFVNKGFKAILVCVDTKVLSKEFSGRFYDHDLLNALPKEIDPCGENGEFHTFVFDGPIFKNRVDIERGQTIVQDGFAFTDIF